MTAENVTEPPICLALNMSKVVNVVQSPAGTGGMEETMKIFS